MSHNFKVSEEDGSWNLLLGDGNVMIGWGHNPKDIHMACVFFSQVKENRKIGSTDAEMERNWKPGCSYMDFDGYSPGLHIWFAKIESIDVLIEALNMAKEQMKNPVDLRVCCPAP